jgi:ribonuclease PH
LKPNLCGLNDVCTGLVGRLSASPMLDHVAAVSGGIVEIQGAAEGEPFTREQTRRLIDLAEASIRQLVASQKAALAAWEGWREAPPCPLVTSGLGADGHDVPMDISLPP